MSQFTLQLCTVLARTTLSFTGHLNRSIDGVFEIVCSEPWSRPIAEVHSIIARAHFAQREAEMARDRFRFLERHGFLNRHWEAVAIQLPAKARS